MKPFVAGTVAGVLGLVFLFFTIRLVYDVKYLNHEILSEMGYRVDSDKEHDADIRRLGERIKSLEQEVASLRKR